MPDNARKFLGRITIRQSGTYADKQNGEIRSLMSLSERADGSVIFSFPTTSLVYEKEEAFFSAKDPVSSDFVKNRHISIHSTRSSETINTFTEKLDYEEGHHKPFYQKT